MSYWLRGAIISSYCVAKWHSSAPSHASFFLFCCETSCLSTEEFLRVRSTREMFIAAGAKYAPQVVVHLIRARVSQSVFSATHVVEKRGDSKTEKPTVRRLQEVFNRAYAEHSEELYREQHPLSNTDIIKINSAICHEMYNAKGLEDGCLTFTELQKKFPNFLRYLRKEIEKKYEILQKCVAQWGVDWAIQRVLQRDKRYQQKGLTKKTEGKGKQRHGEVPLDEGRGNRKVIIIEMSSRAMKKLF